MDTYGSGMVAGAHCPRHPAQEAARTCTRCGTFMCDICSEGGLEGMCLECRERTGLKVFPFDRGNWSFSGLWDYCWQGFQREWLMLSLAALVVMGVSFTVQMVAGLLPMIGTALDSMPLMVVLQAVAIFLQNAVQGVLALGFLRMAYDVLEGQKADLSRLFSQVHKTGTYLLTMLLLVLMVAVPLVAVGGVIGGLAYATGSLRNEETMMVIVGLATLGLIIPAIYYFLPLYLLQPAMAFQDNPSPMGIIRHCYAVARGERLSLLGVGLVAVLVLMGGLVACCVGIIPAIGFTQLLMGGLYLALRDEGSEEE